MIRIYKRNGLQYFIKKIKLRCLITLLAFVLLTLPLYVCAQKQNNIWCFGDSAGIDFNNISNPTTFVSSLDTRGSCVSIADSNGNLLFYANTRATLPGNTTLIWNKNHQLMQNGDSIVGRGWYNELIILPTCDTKKFFIFSAASTSIFGLYYSIVDLNYNNGLGKITQKNIQLNNLKTWDGIAAIKHANGRDWWLISKDYENLNGDNNFRINLITCDTIVENIQSIGAQELGNSGIMTFSKDGNKFLFTSYNGVVEVMDFDRCNGQLSNPLIILNAGNFPKILGSAFSPNGNVIYVSTCNGPSYLVQYDLTASNIFNSRDTIATILSPQEAGGALRLAPDNKIYWSCIWENGIQFSYPYADTMYHTENMNLSVINDPDVVGSGCNISLYSFYLGGKRCYWGLPNNPDYSLGPAWGSVCDSLTNGIEEFKNRRKYFSIYPNPVNEEMQVVLDYSSSGEKYFYLTNCLGKVIRKVNIKNGQETIRISSNELDPGIYYLELIFDDGVAETQKIIVIH